MLLVAVISAWHQWLWLLVVVSVWLFDYLLMKYPYSSSLCTFLYPCPYFPYNFFKLYIYIYIYFLRSLKSPRREKSRAWLLKARIQVGCGPPRFSCQHLSWHILSPHTSSTVHALCLTIWHISEYTTEE